MVYVFTRVGATVFVLAYTVSFRDDVGPGGMPAGGVFRSVATVPVVCHKGVAVCVVSRVRAL